MVKFASLLCCIMLASALIAESVGAAVWKPSSGYVTTDDSSSSGSYFQLVGTRTITCKSANLTHGEIAGAYLDGVLDISDCGMSGGFVWFGDPTPANQSANISFYAEKPSIAASGGGRFSLSLGYEETISFQVGSPTYFAQCKYTLPKSTRFSERESFVLPASQLPQADLIAKIPVPVTVTSSGPWASYFCGPTGTSYWQLGVYLPVAWPQGLEIYPY